MAFMRPCVIAVGVQITAIFLSMGYRAFAIHIPVDAEQVVFVVWAVIYSYAILDVMALVRTVAMHGLYRARLATVTDQADDAGRHAHWATCPTA